jgi:energy-converting hydrogenase B subunit Q
MTNSEIYAISILSENCQGVLRDVSEIMAKHDVNIVLAQASVLPAGDEKGSSFIYFEFENVNDIDSLSSDLSKLITIHSVQTYQPLSKIFGKRVIIIGGGAQVAQVAMGAVNEADRHNIRGERISVDTIPLVGEKDLSATIDAVGRLPRVAVLVLAGSLMGGSISESVDKIRALGIPVISLNMAGSVPKHGDLVVTDPLQGGVFAVMHASDLAVFNIKRVRGRKF